MALELRALRVALFATAFLGCAAAPNLQQQKVSAAPALSSLVQGHFEEASTQAESTLGAQGDNQYARLVRAIARYKATNHQLSLDLRTALFGAMGTRGLNHRYLRSTLAQAETDLALVDKDLAIVTSSGPIAIELCLACWDIDWNGNGRVDSRDRRLLEIEQDAEGNSIPEEDPRRRPTFRFDDGDIWWARAFVSFQRAALDLLLAYDLSGLDSVIAERDRDRKARVVVLKLAERDRIRDARQRILDGLEQSDRARRLYLAETDDDREWVPNPRQQNHPLPLPVNQALYDTWEGVVGDLRRLVEGEEGLSVAEIVELAEHRADQVPQGYVDIGRMLSNPKDLVLDLRSLQRMERERDLEGLLSGVLGEYYRKGMKPSPLLKRLSRMKGEVDRREETIERKLRYLFWIN